MENLQPEITELNSRRSDKLTVTLWWVKGTINMFVTVTDSVNHIELTVETPDGVLPHHVYEHPFAYIPREPEAA